MPRILRTAVVAGGAAHMGAKRAQKSAAAQQQTAEQVPQQQAAQNQAAAPDANSQADEIRKYAAMKDQGLITEEEFAAKKKAILGI